MVELLSPVGDFECLKSAVQNGANAVYFGANLFSARSFATNFDTQNLKQAINYAKLRGVKTHLTLNTLIKDEEFEEAFNLAKTAYKFGIDAIIVQDLGLATQLIKSFPDLEIHASTQMTANNLEGVKALEQLGFKRVVLSRETSLAEIEHICLNCNAEIEVFVHGALCISYSGQCLFSSLVGGRSGNRGSCAQPCRLPYTLQNNEGKVLDKGYLLSTRDICSLEVLPNLIKAGVSSFKIEGRMKSPIYVATVTRIYRKYIDLAIKYINNEIDKYEISQEDKTALLQVFNRGGFSSGHLSNKPNKKLIFKDKPNNMGIYLGKILKYNPSKGLITVKLENDVSLGDSISFENESSMYTISELMIKNSNIKNGQPSQIVTFGRMKGNIKIQDKIYKITDKELSTFALNSFSKEYRKTTLDCKLNILTDKKIEVFVHSNYFNIDVNFVYDYIPDIAQNAPISKDKIITQFIKTQNTCFEFSNIEINLDNNLFVPTSILNDIRRTSISNIEEKILKSFERSSNAICLNIDSKASSSAFNQEKIACLHTLNIDEDYSNLKTFDKIYIPLRYFVDNEFKEVLNGLQTISKIYIYMPVVIKDSYLDITKNQLNKAFDNFNISGIVISNISELNLIKNINKSIELIANYTFNVFNSYTAKELERFGFSSITLSPELNEEELSHLNTSSKEVIVSGKLPLMTISYCLLGKSNKCYKECPTLCKANNSYVLKDRYNFEFEVIPDNTQTITTIYNSRDTNINTDNLNVKNLRYDFK